MWKFGKYLKIKRKPQTSKNETKPLQEPNGGTLCLLSKSSRSSGSPAVSESGSASGSFYLFRRCDRRKDHRSSPTWTPLPDAKEDGGQSKLTRNRETERLIFILHSLSVFQHGRGRTQRTTLYRFVLQISRVIQSVSKFWLQQCVLIN